VGFFPQVPPPTQWDGFLRNPVLLDKGLRLLGADWVEVEVGGKGPTFLQPRQVLLCILDSLLPPCGYEAG
jgi:hypothetical protein